MDKTKMNTITKSVQAYIDHRIGEINREVSTKHEEAKRSQGEQLGYILGWIGDCQARRSELHAVQSFLRKLNPNQESV
jgi:hypothetical protein